MLEQKPDPYPLLTQAMVKAEVLLKNGAYYREEGLLGLESEKEAVEAWLAGKGRS
jgi:hypothetical protein